MGIMGDDIMAALAKMGRKERTFVSGVPLPPPPTHVYSGEQKDSRGFDGSLSLYLHHRVGLQDSSPEKRENKQEPSTDS